MPKISLKKELQNRIKEAVYLSREDVERITKNMGFVSSNAERRLRPSESPMIKEVKNEKGFIVGYEWAGEDISRNNAFRPGFTEKKQKELTKLFV